MTWSMSSNNGAGAAAMVEVIKRGIRKYRKNHPDESMPNLPIVDATPTTTTAATAAAAVSERTNIPFKLFLLMLHVITVLGAAAITGIIPAILLLWLYSCVTSRNKDSYRRID